MPYVIKCQDDYRDAEAGIVRRCWAMESEYQIAEFDTKKAAQSDADNYDESSGYDGILTHNVLSRGVVCGYAPMAVWVSANVRNRPQWAQRAGNVSILPYRKIA